MKQSSIDMLGKKIFFWVITSLGLF